MSGDQGQERAQLPPQPKNSSCTETASPRGRPPRRALDDVRVVRAEHVESLVRAESASSRSEIPAGLANDFDDRPESDSTSIGKTASVGG